MYGKNDLRAPRAPTKRPSCAHRSSYHYREGKRMRDEVIGKLLGMDHE